MTLKKLTKEEFVQKYKKDLINKKYEQRYKERHNVVDDYCYERSSRYAHNKGRKVPMTRKEYKYV